MYIYKFINKTSHIYTSKNYNKISYSNFMGYQWLYVISSAGFIFNLKI